MHARARQTALHEKKEEKERETGTRCVYVYARTTVVTARIILYTR